MKIAQIVCTFPPYRSGIGNVAANFYHACKDSQNDCLVFVPNYDNKKIDNPDIILLKPLLKFGNGAFIPGLFTHLMNEKIDIVHLHYPFFGGMEIVWLAKKIFPEKFKLIIHYHMNVSHLPWYLEILRLPSRLINKSLFNIADGITCASLDYIANNDVFGIYKKYQNKFFELPFGVDTDKFQRGNTPKKKQFLFVGGMDKAHSFKGIDVLLDAFSQLKDKELKLKLIGSGALSDSYKQYAEKLGISDRVVFAGNSSNEELAQSYRESLALILPSINSHEAFGVVLLEAMASGTPVIASKLPGVRKVFQEEGQGYYFPVGDSHALKEKMKKILSGDLEKFNTNARELALKKYDSKIIDKQLLTYYQNIHESRHN